MAKYYPILMKFGTQTKKHMPSSKNAKAGVRGHFPRWPTPPSCKSSLGYRMAKYGPILMKIGTQTKKHMPSSKTYERGFTAISQDGRRLNLENQSESVSQSSGTRV